MLKAELRITNLHQDEETKEMVPYMTQAQFTYDLLKIKDIVAPKADTISIGSEQIITFTDLLQTELFFSWEAHSESWSHEAVQITLLPKMLDIPLPDIQSPLSLQLHAFDEMEKGIIKMVNGLVEMGEGAEELENGFAEYQEGFMLWSKGFNELQYHLPALREAFQEYLKGTALMKEAFELILAGLEEAEQDFEQLAREMEQAQTALKQIQLQMAMYRTNHEEILDTMELMSKDADDIRSLARKVQSVYDEDAEPWILAEMVLDHLHHERKINELLKAQTPRMDLIFSVIQEMQQRITQNYLPLLETTLEAYEELLNGIKELDMGAGKLSEGLQEGEKGVDLLIEGVEELGKGKSLLEKGLQEIEKGISQLATAPALLIESLRRLLYEGVQPMSHQVKLLSNEVQNEEERLSHLQSIAKQHQNTAIMIKIEFPSSPIFPSHQLMYTPSKAKPQSLIQQLINWLQNLFINK